MRTVRQKKKRKKNATSSRTIRGQSGHTDSRTKPRCSNSIVLSVCNSNGKQRIFFVYTSEELVVVDAKEKVSHASQTNKLRAGINNQHLCLVRRSTVETLPRNRTIKILSCNKNGLFMCRASRLCDPKQTTDTQHVRHTTQTLCLKRNKITSSGRWHHDKRNKQSKSNKCRGI